MSEEQNQKELYTLQTSDVEKMFAEAGVPRARETINKWCRKGILLAKQDEGPNKKEVWFINRASVERQIAIVKTIRHNAGPILRSDHLGPTPIGSEEVRAKLQSLTEDVTSTPQEIVPESPTGSDIVGPSPMSIDERLLQQMEDELTRTIAEKKELLEKYSEHVTATDFAHRESQEKIIALSQRVVDMSVELQRLRAIEATMAAQPKRLGWFGFWRKDAHVEGPRQLDQNSEAMPEKNVDQSQERQDP